MILILQKRKTEQLGRATDKSHLPAGIILTQVPV